MVLMFEHISENEGNVYKKTFIMYWYQISCEYNFDSIYVAHLFWIHLCIASLMGNKWTTQKSYHMKNNHCEYWNNCIFWLNEATTIKITPLESA